MNNAGKERAPQNRTLGLSDGERDRYRRRLVHLDSQATLDRVRNRTINQDLFEALPHLPARFIDLLFIDPPYNISKSWRTVSFKRQSIDEYALWMDSWLNGLIPTLKPTASIYICGDWQSSAAIHQLAQKHFIVRNRITWEREKGRGARTNWKNCSEDIWFCTLSDDYVFNANAVKLRKRVIAPYTTNGGEPKDWERTEKGNYRLTHPSNIWTDITVPFWSMPENTEHPTQKPEKLLAKIILASSNPGDMVFDPFLGSGTTSVAAKKLGRAYSGVESDEMYCCIAEKRLEIAESDKGIQGYSDGVFRERNTLPEQVNERIAHFQRVREFWLSKTDF